MLQEYQWLFWPVVGTLILAVAIVKGFAKSINGEKESGDEIDDTHTQCKSEACVRCNTYKNVLGVAYKRLKHYNSNQQSELLRIHEAIAVDADQEKKFEVKLQCPNVLYIPGLTAKPWWECTRQDMEVIIQNNIKDIRDEYMNVSTSDDGWLLNTTPTGSWNVFHLMNQGSFIEANCQKCPLTTQVINLVEDLMVGNVFGNACFSVLHPGTHITPHYGPTNARLRCHIPVGEFRPSGCYLTVAKDKRECWLDDGCVFFDDSFLHEAIHEGIDSEPRAVLILDLWHPDINKAERDALNYIFSPNA
ncbi:unnamed protein product [Owenia fusiformis]|uniref:Uncharacterized protein n=1 Tax=Owenia fusiformis TaxID=6347 RepID=A0A8J1XNQ7_OWEFU|nr:unnamed protein product [Owenia fusiformis]